MKRRLPLAPALALLGLATAAAAGGLPRLPKETALPRGADSPGVVTFRHDTHVDARRPDCTVCHPGTFPILSTTQPKPITHAEMEKGRACGTCHDGRSASGLDDCSACHEG